MKSLTRVMQTGLARGICCVFSLVLCIGPAEAAMWDLGADWSDDQNPNGVWTLMKSNTATFTINQPDYFQNGSNQRAWADEPASLNAHVPFWLKGKDNGVIIAHGAELDRTGTDYTSAVWTSPLAGDVQVGGALWNTWRSGRQMRWQLRVNDTVVSQGDLYGNGVYDEASPFALADGNGGSAALTQTVQIGDRLELALVSMSSGGNLGDNLGVEFTIVPEPATLSLLAVGALAIMRRRRH